MNPIAVQNPQIDVLTENCRSVSLLQHASLGYVAFVAVGATLVGSVQLLKEASEPTRATESRVRQVGEHFEKGDCYGYFQRPGRPNGTFESRYGGSTCFSAFRDAFGAWGPEACSSPSPARLRGIRTCWMPHSAGWSGSF